MSERNFMILLKFLNIFVCACNFCSRSSNYLLMLTINSRICIKYMHMKEKWKKNTLVCHFLQYGTLYQIVNFSYYIKEMLGVLQKSNRPRRYLSVKLYCIKMWHYWLILDGRLLLCWKKGFFISKLDEALCHITHY